MYIPNSRVGGSQGKVRYVLDDFNTFLKIANDSDPKCISAMSKALCIHYYLPCGVNGSLHVPQFLCPDTCRYLTDVACSTLWPSVVKQLTTGLPPDIKNMGLDPPVCNNTSMAVAFLNLSEDCCSTGGVMIPSAPVTSDPYGVIIGFALGSGLTLLVAMTIISLITFLCWKGKKMRRRSIDMAIRYCTCHACTGVFVVSICLENITFNPYVQFSSKSCL